MNHSTGHGACGARHAIYATATLAVTLLFTPFAVNAQPGCETRERHRDFDFWIGEWTVVQNDTSRAVAGSNRIESKHLGCVLEENWTSSTGGTGSSMNFYDATAEVWRQVWVAPGYLIDIEGGLNDSGAMVLEGELRSWASGSVSPFRGTWTPVEEGVVRQHFEIADPETGVWSTWFDGLYLRDDGS